MIKTPSNFPFVTNDCEDFLSGVSSADIFIETMSFDNMPNIDEIEDALSVLNDIVTHPPIPPTHTEEDINNIHQLYEELINLDPISSTTNSNDLLIQSNDLLLNYREQNLIDLELSQCMTGIAIPINSSSNSSHSSTVLGPLSPITDVSHGINSLTIDRISHDLSPVMSPSNSTSSTHLSSNPSVINHQRIRYDSDGPHYYTDNSFMEIFGNTSIENNSLQTMGIMPSNRGGHSAQLPYSRSLTDPLPFALPEFSTFRQSTSSQTASNLAPLMANTIGSKPPLLYNMIQPNNIESYLSMGSMERWSSEPVLPNVMRIPERNRPSSTHRGRPFSRHQNTRRTPTTAQRREQLENQMTALEITNYELNSQYRSFFGAVQHLRHRLRLDTGLTENDLDRLLAQGLNNNNTKEGPN